MELLGRRTPAGGLRKRPLRRGFTLIEVMSGVMVLSLAVCTMQALLPTSALLRDRSGRAARAAAITQSKLEQVYMLPFDQLTYAGLAASSITDGSGSSPAPFTLSDRLGSQLIRGAGTIALTDAAEGLKQVEVVVTWTDHRGRPYRFQAMTYVANKEVSVSQ